MWSGKSTKVTRFPWWGGNVDSAATFMEFGKWCGWQGNICLKEWSWCILANSGAVRLSLQHWSAIECTVKRFESRIQWDPSSRTANSTSALTIAIELSWCTNNHRNKQQPTNGKNLPTAFPSSSTCMFGHQCWKMCASTTMASLKFSLQDPLQAVATAATTTLP